MLPIVMRTTEEAIRAVPKYIRWGSYGLGATKWQTVSRIVLPAAMPRIITGIILAMGRAVGRDRRRHLHDGHDDQPADLAARLRAGR